MSKEQRLVWNGEEYTCDYDGRTLYVDGDAWSEARAERALEFLGEKYPDLSQEELRDMLASASQAADDCLDKAADELLDPSIWALHAIECRYDDEEDILVPLNKEEGKIHDFSAWIV